METEPAEMTQSVRPLLAFVLLTLAACDEDVLGPLNGTAHALQSVDGESLPVTVAGGFGELAWVVTADTIWLDSGSRWRRHSVQHREAGVGGDPLDVEASGRVVRGENGALILAFECDDSDCLTPDRLVQTEAGLRMDETHLHAGTDLVFRPL